MEVNERESARFIGFSSFYDGSGRDIIYDGKSLEGIWVGDILDKSTYLFIFIFFVYCLGKFHGLFNVPQSTL